MPAPGDGVAHRVQCVFEFERVGQRAVLDVLLHRLPVGCAQVELELGGHQRVDSEGLTALDLSGQHAPRRQEVGGAVGVVGVGECEGVAGPVGQQAQRRGVGNERTVEVAAVHVDELVVGKVVRDVEDEHGVGDVDAGGEGAAEEPFDGHPLAAEVPLGVGRGHLDGVHVGGGGPGPGRLDRFGVDGHWRSSVLAWMGGAVRERERCGRGWSRCAGDHGRVGRRRGGARRQARRWSALGGRVRAVRRAGPGYPTRW